jgi:hypothetical protein
MIVGVTGSRTGPTHDQQVWALKQFCPGGLAADVEQLEHGACEGVDWFFHMVAMTLPGIKIVVRPATGTASKWTHQGCLVERPGVMVMPAKPPLDRTHDIVDDSGVVFAFPEQHYEVLRSGTWAGIRYARKCRKRLYICFPNGDIGG